MAEDHLSGKDLLYEEDLRPNNRAGENRGAGPGSARTAYDIKQLHRMLCDLPDDVLKQIPVLETGERLQMGAVYFDLAHPERGAFTGMNDQEAAPDECLIRKSDIDFELWNRLTGARDAERLGRFAA